MLYDFLNEFYENGGDDTYTLLNDAINQWQNDSETRNNELIQFLDEFVNSEEYKQYLARKKKIRKHTVYTQYCLEDLENIAIEDKYPLTTQSKKMIIFKQYFDKYIKNKENMEIVKKQEKGIQMIKEKITQFKRLYELTKDKIRQKKEKHENKILKEFCESLNIDVSTLNLKSRSKIKNTVVCYRKIKNSRNMKIKNNIMEIVKKLTEEYQRKKQIEKTLNKTYLYKVKKTEKVLKNMEIVGQKIILKPREKYKKEDVEIVYEEVPVEEEEIETNKEKGKKDSKKNKKTSEKEKDKSKKKDKKEKTPKEKKPKKEKKGKKKGDELIIPPIPKCNLREKLGPDNYDKMLEVLTDFENLEDMLEDQHILAQKRNEAENLYDDRNFFYKPTALIFKNFYCGKIYKKKLKIINTSIQFQKLRILDTVFSDPYDALFFKVEPLFGIKKLASGCFLHLTVTFSPKIESKQIDGRIVFVAYNRHSTQYQKFFIRIQCIPSYSELNICPKDINFGKIPMWRTCSLKCKTIKLRNSGRKACEAVIKKAPDPLKTFDKNANSVQRYTNAGYISDILQECLDNVFNHFEFDRYYIKIQGFEEIKLNIKFKNVDYVGNYFEIYYLDILETCENNSTECTGCQQISISAETTSNFMEVSPDCLDFGVCMINSIYQLSCDIYNNSLVTQSISLKFPSNLIDYIKTDVSNIYIPSHAKRTVWLKFLPRKSVLETPNYDKATSILEFPVYFCVLSKTYPDIPPLKAIVFAILTPQKCLTIIPTKRKIDEIPSETATLNLGECTIFETVFADIDVLNNTLAPQIYTFTNVPQCLTLMPNYGFCKILPKEQKTLRINFSPDFTEIADNFMTEGSQWENVLHFKINLETISFLGQYKIQLNIKRLRKVVDLMIKEIKNQKCKELTQDINICAYCIKINWFSQQDGEGSPRDKYYSESTLQKLDNTKQAKPCTTQLWLKAKITIPRAEFSHQYVAFPDTPSGSYSTMQINLRWTNAEYFFKKSQIDDTILFRIFGGSEEIIIEPTYGSLKKGESKKITLIVKPCVPKEIVTNIAKQFKYSEVYELKKQEYEMSKQGGKGKKGKDKKEKKNDKQAKDKKSKNENKKSEKGEKKSKDGNKQQKEERELEEKKSEIIVTDKELTLDYLDFYPAEMYHWRNLQPYFIKAEFACAISYESENMKNSEMLYLNAACRVIRPDFITNLKLQRIDFGQIVIGMSKSESVIIQNIHHVPIKPEFSLLSPVGPFELPLMKSTKTPPEHFLQLPITFEPEKEGKVEEYFEITSGPTILSLILQGTGVAPNIEIIPKYLVLRLDTKRNSITQCPIEIRNKNDCELTITIEKLFELKGFIKEPVKTEETKKETTKEKGKGGKADKADKKSKTSKETNKNKKAGIQKFSDQLTEAEEYSLGKFTKQSGEFFYDTINMVENKINVKPKSTKVVKIGFGLPELILAKKKEEIRKLQEDEKDKGKGKKGKGDKTEKASKGSKKSDFSKDVVKKLPETQIYHVTKYNIMLNRKFLKDFIFISTITE